MAETEVIVDESSLNTIAAKIEKAKAALIGQMAERGYQLLRREVPKATRNLEQGVAPPLVKFQGVAVSTSENKEGTTRVDYENSEAELTVSARSARTTGGQGLLIGADGQTKRTVSLSPQPAYNYAEVVARGNREVTMSPTHAKAFLIPVRTTPTGEAYVSINGEKFIFRKSRKGQRANPFDVRAGRRLEVEAPKIAEEVMQKIDEK